MSMKKLALIAAVSSYTRSGNSTSTTSYYSLSDGGALGHGGGFNRQNSMRSGPTLHGNVNILLGGGMLSVVITIVCILCYCCHRNIKKRTALYRQRWLDSDNNLEIYSVEQCYETSGLFMETSEGIPNSMLIPGMNHGEPPPSYDVVVAMDHVVGRPSPPPGYRPLNQINCFKSERCKYALSHTSNYSRHNEELHRNAFSNHFRESDCTEMCRCESCCSLVGELAGIGAGGGGNSGASPLVGGNKTANFQVNDTENNNNNNAEEYYYRGCSLCGKFRYTSSSIDSGFENIINANRENGNDDVDIDENCGCPSENSSQRGENRPAERTLVNSSCMQRDSRSDYLQGNGTNFASENLETFGECSAQSVMQQVCNNNNNSTQANPTTSSEIEAENSLNNNNNNIESDGLESINENGIIRLDMSRIIDKTGLPTYEAALKLESSGYV